MFYVYTNVVFFCFNNSLWICADAGDQRLNIIADSVDPVTRRSFLENYDGNASEFYVDCSFRQLKCYCFCWRRYYFMLIISIVLSTIVYFKYVVAAAIVVGIGFSGLAVCLLIICCGVVCLHKLDCFDIITASYCVAEKEAALFCLNVANIKKASKIAELYRCIYNTT